jgi:hyperosmotically inducible periplasmic protein
MKWITYIAPCLCLAAAMAQPPDNTTVNKRDDVKDAITAGTQSNAKVDLDLTRRIRREITQNKEMSTYAKNIKIISRDGAVTLRGPVKSQDERQRIDSIAKKVAGNSKVDNQLEIAAAK